MSADTLAVAAMETQRRFLLLESELHGRTPTTFDGVTLAPTAMPDAQWNVAWIGRSPRDPAAALARVRKGFADPPLPYTAWVAEGLDPDGSPLASALAAAGYRRLIRIAVMALDLGVPVSKKPDPPEGTRIVAATANEMPDEIAVFSSRAFTQPPELWRAYLRPRRGDPRITDFLAFDDEGDRIIGAVTLIALGEGVRVNNLGTVPEWRRRGLGRALLSRALCAAADAGHTHATLTPTSEGRPLYEHTGFEEVSAVTVWMPPPARAAAASG